MVVSKVFGRICTTTNTSIYYFQIEAIIITIQTQYSTCDGCRRPATFTEGTIALTNCDRKPVLPK